MASFPAPLSSKRIVRFSLLPEEYLLVVARTFPVAESKIA